VRNCNELDAEQCITCVSFGSDLFNDSAANATLPCELNCQVYVAAFHWSRHWSVAWVGRPAARRTNWAFDV